VIGPIAAAVVGTVLFVTIKVTHKPSGSVELSPDTESKLRDIEHEQRRIRYSRITNEGS
jgi:hypothetical protein